MRPWMALLALALLAAALPAGQAQPPTFSEAYQLRGAVGDIPTTADMEPAGTWNLEQRLAVHFDNSSQAQHAFNVPEGATLVNATCTCNPSHYAATADSVLFTLSTAIPSGDYVLTVVTSQGAGTSFGFSLNLPIEADADDRVALLYIPNGLQADAPVQPTRSLPCTNGQPCTIVQFDDFASPFWVSVHPEGAAGGDDGDDAAWMEWIVPAAVGLLLGIALWAYLVSKGIVQTKSRRQMAGTAAHVEAAANDPPAILEGRKRALLAALKEIEVAKMNNEMPADVYDAVKADLKRQAVTVMRALESATAADDKKA